MSIFNRTYRLALQATSPDRQVLREDLTGRAEQTETFQRFIIENLHIDFEVSFGERSGSDTDNKVTVWNLPRNIVDTIEDSGEGGMNVTLDCAYNDGERHTVLVGNVSKIMDTFEGVDRKTTLHIRNLRKTIRDKKVQQNFRGAGYGVINPQIVIDWFVDQLTNVEINGNFDAMFKLAQETYVIPETANFGDIRHYSVTGKLWKEFTKFLKRGNLQPYSANNVLAIVENGKGVPNAKVPLISAQQDLIGFPTIDSDGTTSDNFGSTAGAKAFRIKTLLRADVRVGFNVQVIFPRRQIRTRNDAVSGVLGDVRSWTDVDTFTVTNVTHKGSYEGEEWYSEFRIERVGE